MTAQTPPYALQNASHSAALFRQASSSFLGAALPATFSTGGTPGGVIGTGDLQVTADATANMSVNVAAGQCWMAGSQVANQGLYYGLNDATVNLAIAAASSSDPRIDIVVASAQDEEYSGTADGWVLQVVTGTPASSPTAPATPANSVLLAHVAVATNATSITAADITDERAYLRPSLLPAGVPLYGIPTDGSGPLGGVTTQTPFYLQCGTDVFTTNASGGAAVTFGTPFPTGLVAFLPTVGDNNVAGIFVQAISAQTSASGVGVEIFNASGPVGNAAVRVNWAAIGY